MTVLCSTGHHMDIGLKPDEAIMVINIMNDLTIQRDTLKLAISCWVMSHWPHQYIKYHYPIQDIYA